METPVLEGKHVRLEPLREKHLAELGRIAVDPSIWKYMLVNIHSATDLQKWAEGAWKAEAEGHMMPWITIAKQSDGTEELAGGTRFTDIDDAHRTLEIGNSWITEPWRGTKVNTEAKYLQLCFAFETMNIRRVAFKAHASNLRSQAAIKAIGGKYEGTFRNHFILPDGSSRDSAWFSIIDSEWPEVKEMLERRLVAPASR